MRHRANGNGRHEDGFTLIEVLVAMAIFAVVSMGILHSVLGAAQTSGDSRSRVVAANLAAGAVDQARAEGRTDLQGVDTRTWDVVVEGRTYTVLRSAAWVAGTSGGACNAGASGSSLLYKRVGIRVTWPNMGTTAPVRTDTVISPPAGVFDPTRGNLAANVVSRSGTAVELAQVRLSGPSTAVALTDENGCAFFTGLPSGTYSLLLTKTSNVDPQGRAISQHSVTVVAGETVAYQADFDRAASLQITGVANPMGTVADASVHPLPTGAVLSLGQPGLPQGRRLVPAQVGGAVPDIYPFSSGYRTWLGSCSDANPEGSSTAEPPQTWWDGTVETPTTVVDPGVTTPVLVRGAQVELRIMLLGVPVPGATVIAQHPVESGTGCNSGETWTLGTTDANGWVRATMPYGKGWTFRVGGLPVATADLSPSDTYPRVVLP